MRITDPKQTSMILERDEVNSAHAAEKAENTALKSKDNGSALLSQAYQQSSKVDIRASMRQAETGIGAGLLAKQIKSETNLLNEILKEMSSFMSSPSASVGPMIRRFRGGRRRTRRS